MTRTGTIILVEGDASLHEDLVRLVLSTGCTILRFDSALAYIADAQSARAVDDAGPVRCLLVDASATHAAGLDVARFVERYGIDTPVIFLAERPDVRAAVRAMKAGAMDYLAMPVRDVDLLAAIAAAMSHAAARLALRQRHEAACARVARLTVREREVFELVLSGRLNKQVADALGSQVATVKVHRSRLMHKLGVRSLVELLALGRELRPPQPFGWARPQVAAAPPEVASPLRAARPSPPRAPAWNPSQAALQPSRAAGPG